MTTSTRPPKFRKAVGLIAAAAMSADGDVDPAEVARYLMACEDLGIPEEEADRNLVAGFARLDSGEAASAVILEAASSVPRKLRPLCYELMVHVVGADRILAKEELDVLADVADALELSRAFTLGHMARFVRTNPDVRVPSVKVIGTMS
ncbi:MAG: hypothetical protein CMJ33_07640 [Phycisphaerae bacterium]|nr:hypothetical protein [Phycisphaerae bacterium]HAW96650.1 hypothetical protein [Phycisphaerales bacterium]|tara:strand:- start:545 stop:991 length:447 start_codon:yes stop_codon:yes gene_type:complete